MVVKQNRIYVIGSSNTDMVIQAPRLPLPGETIMGGTFFMNAGGKGANQAVAAARLGGQVQFIAKVGNDSFGQQTQQLLHHEGIKVDSILIDTTTPSGIALINVDQKGENSITVAPGANNCLSAAEVINALQNLHTHDFVLIQLEIPLSTVLESITFVAKKNCKVILNPAPVAYLPEDIYEKIYLITPNETEASILSGITVHDANTAHQASEVLYNKGCLNVIITLGALGVYVYTKEFQELIPVEEVEAIDTTAAGDCFNGALAVGLSNGMTIVDAAIFANRAASISVTRLGAQKSMPYKEEIC